MEDSVTWKHLCIGSTKLEFKSPSSNQTKKKGREKMETTNITLKYPRETINQTYKRIEKWSDEKAILILTIIMEAIDYAQENKKALKEATKEHPDTEEILRKLIISEAILTQKLLKNKTIDHQGNIKKITGPITSQMRIEQAIMDAQEDANPTYIR